MNANCFQMRTLLALQEMQAVDELNQEGGTPSPEELRWNIEESQAIADLLHELAGWADPERTVLFDKYSALL